MKFVFFASLFSVWSLANANSQETNCSSLALTHQTHKSVQILTVKEFLPDSVNLNNSGEGSIQNTFGLCQVQGFIKYHANPRTGKIEFDANGNDTLTWELLLPDPKNYNGRFLAVGERPVPIKCKAGVDLDSLLIR